MSNAAIDAGYSKSMANDAGRKLESKHQKLIRDVLPVIGAHSAHLAEVLAAGLGAKRVYQDRAGLHESEIPDHKERRETIKLIGQFTGELDTKTTVAVQVVLPTVATDKAAWGEE